MRKTNVTLLAALFIAATMSTGHAADNKDSMLSVTGEATLKWERAKPAVEPSNRLGEQTLKMNLSQNLSEQVSLYGRFSYRNFSGDVSDKSIHEFDQYGLIYKADKGTLTLGSQEATLGTVSGLLDLTEVGRDNLFLGAAWVSETDQGRLRLLAGRVDKTLLDADRTVTGLEASKAFGAVTITGEYLHVSNQPVISTVYGLGLKSAIDKWEFSLEGLRSSASEARNGLLAGVAYSLAENESLSATYRSLKANAVVTGLATYDAGTKGVELAWEKSLNERLNIKLSHEWMKSIDTQAKERVTAIETTYTF